MTYSLCSGGKFLAKSHQVWLEAGCCFPSAPSPAFAYSCVLCHSKASSTLHPYLCSFPLVLWGPADFKSPKENPDVHPLSATPEGGFRNSWDGERQFDGWSLCTGPGICVLEKGHIGGRGRTDFTFILSHYYKTVVLFQFHFMPVLLKVYSLVCAQG